MVYHHCISPAITWSTVTIKEASENRGSKLTVSVNKTEELVKQKENYSID